VIEDYSFGRLVVNGETHTRDVIVFPDCVQPSWWRRKGHEVCAGDLQEVLAAAADVVVFGTGAHGLVKVLPEARDALVATGAAVVEEPTESACETFNRLHAEGKKVVAALHLTC